MPHNFQLLGKCLICGWGSLYMGAEMTASGPMLRVYCLGCGASEIRHGWGI